MTGGYGDKKKEGRREAGRDNCQEETVGGVESGDGQATGREGGGTTAPAPAHIPAPIPIHTRSRTFPCSRTLSISSSSSLTLSSSLI